MLTTLEAVQAYLSEQGATAFADHDQDGTADEGVIDTCVAYANAHVLGAVSQRYTAANAALSPVLQEAATVIATRKLCMRRGNSAPATVASTFEELTQAGGMLDKIAQGRLRLSQADGTVIPMKAGSAPSHANLKVDRRFVEERIRVVDGSSSMPPTRLERDVDVNYVYE